MAKEFVHLHNHSEFSLLDGMLRVQDPDGKHISPFLLNLGKARPGQALAITDHGNMYGAMKFFFNAKAAGLKPIIGCEVYHTLGDRKDKTAEHNKTGHLTLIAENNIGYRNLMKMVSSAFIEGFYRHPRVDRELLERYHEGIIALSGCMQSHVSKACREQRYDDASKIAAECADIFGKNNYYIELQDHQIPEETEILPRLMEIAKKLGLPMVVTNDCHYEKKEDWEAHDLDLCIGTGKKLNDEKRMRMTTHELYFKSPEEMWALFPYVPDALKNTLAIAERCDIDIDTKTLHLPKFKIPEKYYDASVYNTPGKNYEPDYYYLKDLCVEGMHKKLPKAGPEYWERLDYELDVIGGMKFPSYFLIVREFINWARENDIPVGPGRGSGAGSIVTYTLDITRVDPLPFNLLFERFLNPDRINMPDLDIDISDEGRERVVEHVRNKYGQSCVANIITYGGIKAKSAIKDVGRVMDIPIPEVNEITKHIPDKETLSRTIANVEKLQSLSAEDKKKEENKALLDLQDLAKFVNDPRYKKLFGMAVKVEGLTRQTGVHAAGVIISEEDITNYSPLANQNNKHCTTTQYDGPMLGDTLGMLKVDFLGLKTLSLIENAVKMIRKTKDPDFDIYSIPLDDKKTYELLQEGNTTAVFQLESDGIKGLVKSMQPSVFSDMSALVALYRPGPMGAGMLEMFVERKHGRQAITYDHPLLEPILKETYGTMLYQEQIMQISRAMGNFTRGEADTLRKAMGKKKIEMMNKMGTKFVEQAKEVHGVPEKVSQKIYEDMKKFAGYGFNKSHSVCYGLIAYQTAWLKANFPVEFMTAAMTNQIGQNATSGEEKDNLLVTYIHNAQDMGIEVLGPDVNKSVVDFSIEDRDGKKAIRFAMTAISGIGAAVVENIVKEREKNGPFKSFEEFTMRADPKLLNKRVLESLSKGGAFDCLFQECGNIVKARNKAIDAVTSFNAGGLSSINQMGLFGSEEQGTSGASSTGLSEKELFEKEHEVLGLYFSGHPLNTYRRAISMIAQTKNRAVLNGEHKEKETVKIGGLITAIRNMITKKGDNMAKFTLYDESDCSVECCVFPKVYRMFGQNVAQNKAVIVSGKVQLSSFSNSYELLADEVIDLYDALNKCSRALVLTLPENDLHDQNKLKRIQSVLTQSWGLCPVYFQLSTKDKATYLAETGCRIGLSEKIINDIECLVGPRNWKIDTGK